MPAGKTDDGTMDLIDCIPSELLVGKDAENIRKADSEFKKFSWTDLKGIIGNNRLEKLSRTPSDLRAYLKWKSQIIKEYESVANYVLTERLHWGPDPSLSEPMGTELLQHKEDFKILMNDFPYGLEDGIVHVVVWSKIAIPKAQTMGLSSDISSDARRSIQDFINEKFRDALGMADEDILWFKNWAALQSIREIDHFHILLHQPPATGEAVERFMDLLSDDVRVKEKWAAVDSRIV